jgi:hypothetical protein
VHGILRHLQPGCGDASGIRRLARPIEDACLAENVRSAIRGRHVCAFTHDLTPVPHEIARVSLGKFVLRGARERDVTRHGPRLALRVVFRAKLRAKIGESAAP